MQERMKFGRKLKLSPKQIEHTRKLITHNQSV
jgi:hypothetical protein